MYETEEREKLLKELKEYANMAPPDAIQVIEQ